MASNMNDLLKHIFDDISRTDYIKPEDLPNIDLYMDQVTTFMESQLSSTKRYPEDKILTKTMILDKVLPNFWPFILRYKNNLPFISS